MLEQHKQPHHQCCKDKPDGHNLSANTPQERLVLRTRTVVHDTMRRRQRSQSQCSKSIHNEIDPQHLRDGERRIGAGKSPYCHREARRDIDHHLEQNKPLDVLIERTPPHHGIRNRGKRVVHYRHIACLLSHRRAVAHREPDIGGIERRRIIGAIARDGYHLAQPTQQANGTLLIVRTGARDNLDIGQTLHELLIGHGG